MSTIPDIEIIELILRNNGTYPGDPQCFSVLTYTNRDGSQTYAVTSCERDANRYTPSLFCIAPANLWTCHQGLTPLGEAWLRERAGRRDSP